MSIKHYSIKLFFFLLINILITSNSYSEILKKINVSGNDRVSKETVIMFSKLNIGDDIKNEDLNNVLKNLYYTDYFKNVTINLDNGVVNISVIENPIIQFVKIKGVDKKKIFDNIKELTSKIEKYPFVENKINDQVTLIKNTLKSNGYYFSDLKTSIIYNENNTVDLIYDINLGKIAKIKKISFIGNKIFRDSTLRNIIISEENKFWKFLTSNKYLDINRVNADVFKLNNYYKNRGYFAVNIKSTTAIINEDKQFELIFNINAGEKFFFDKLKIVNKNEYDDKNLNKFQEKFDDLEGKKYSIKVLENLVDELNNYILENEFIFINASYKQIVKDKNKIDIVINFDDLDKEYVERINIFGNFITDEKVIRNKLVVDEGDPYNDMLFDKSISTIKSMDIFKSVKYETSSENDQKKTINIIVEEKPTGEIFAGAGTGTTGSSLTGGIKEKNYLGLGIKLDTNLTFSDDSIKGKFSVINPNYNNSDKSIKTTIESSTSDFTSTAGYKTSRTGFIIGTEFEQMNNMFVNLELSNYYEDLETSSSATSLLKKQEGNYFENLFSYTLKYNKLDQNFNPTDGYINFFSQTLPIYSDDQSIENEFTSSAYHSLSDNLILSANFYLNTINSLDDNVRVSKRVFVPSRRLRGFETGKIGPKDGNQYIGGNYASALNLNSTLPNVFFEKENIDLNLFLDLANVWEVDYNSSLDSSKIRSSTGIAVNWFSAIGPLTFSYAVPLSEADTDITEKFRFQIGTSF